MKFIYTIFLLLITAAYILPVKDIIKGSPGISITDVAEEKEETKIKEKAKEFISFSAVEIFAPVKDLSKDQNNKLSLPSLFHTIEVPPPDNNG
jgi:hypothetical protein